MSKTPKEVARLADALRMLQEVRSLQEVMNIHDTAEAISRYSRQADYGAQIIDEASLIKLLAERRLGEILAEMPLPKAAPGNQHTSRTDVSHVATGPPRLKDLGISRSRSSRAQQIAALPKSKFDAYVSTTVKSGKPPTVAGALKKAKQYQAEKRAKQSRPSAPGFVTDLQTLIDEGRTFSTIMADPPWRHANQGSRASASHHYPTMTIDEICAEPVGQIAARNCHLHLWATSPLLPEAFRVMEAWGFQYKSSFCWVKSQIGLGNYFRIAHEILLFGLRGNLAFRDNSQRSWIEAKRTKHSQKPEAVRKIIEQVSPPDYIEMYGRRAPVRPTWTVYGNQILD